jgi:hypothetical protein
MDVFSELATLPAGLRASDAGAVFAMSSAAATDTDSSSQDMAAAGRGLFVNSRKTGFDLATIFKNRNVPLAWSLWSVVASTSRHIGFLAISGLVLLLAVHMQPASAVWQGKPRLSCIGKQCYSQDFFGWLGLDPKRHYVIAYGTDKVCGVVRDAVNQALRAGKQSLHAVSRPLPESAQKNTWPWHGKPVTEYETRNPIFAGEIFLPWNWMAWAPWPGAKPPQEDDLVDDYSRARWMIAPVFNDGKRMLMTQKAGAGVNVWDVPDDELDLHDWSDWRSYAGYHPLMSYCKIPQPEGRTAGPFDQFSFSCPIGPVEFTPQFPNISAQTRKKEPFATATRSVSVFTFAQIVGRYYTVLQTADQDVLVVDDNGDGMPVPEKYGVFSEKSDLCYLRAYVDKP